MRDPEIRFKSLGLQVLNCEWLTSLLPGLFLAEGKTLPISPPLSKHNLLLSPFAGLGDITVLAFLLSYAAAQTRLPSCLFIPGSVTFYSIFFPLLVAFQFLYPGPIFLTLPPNQNCLSSPYWSPAFSHRIYFPHTCPYPFPPDWLGCQSVLHAGFLSNMLPFILLVTARIVTNHSHLSPRS